MQIVIDIPENRYKDIIRISTIQAYSDYYPTYERIIAKGKVLPEKHGRLIDADKINNSNIEAVKRNGKIYVELSDLQDLIDYAPTVLEADMRGAE